MTEISYDDMRNESREVVIAEQAIYDFLGDGEGGVLDRDDIFTKEFAELFARLSQARLRAAIAIRKQRGGQ